MIRVSAGDIRRIRNLVPATRRIEAEAASAEEDVAEYQRTQQLLEEQATALISEYSALLGEPLTPNTKLDLIDQMLDLSELSLVSVESDLSSELSVLESSIRSVRAAIEQISSIGAASDIERLREQQITADIASVAWSTNGGYCSRTRLKIFDPCCPIPLCLLPRVRGDPSRRQEMRPDPRWIALRLQVRSTSGRLRGSTLLWETPERRNSGLARWIARSMI